MAVKKVFISFFIFLALSSSAQNLIPIQLCVLPTIVKESSGLVTNSPNNIWTHNDSGDSARIYNIDTIGNLQRIFYLNNTHAVDIEDITAIQQKLFFTSRMQEII